MTIVSGFADISIFQLLLVASMALFASIIVGLAGYGTGALMPLVLVPLVGAEPVVPIIAISAIFTNASRAIAYLRYADRRRALIVLACAALTTALGAYGYTRLTNAGAALVIGSMLILSVPLRRVLRRRKVRIGDTGLAAGSVGYGVLVGGTSGSGVILLSLLMAAGLEGAAVIATDAMISLGTGLIKISVFGLAGAVTAQVLAFALLIGGIEALGLFADRLGLSGGVWALVDGLNESLANVGFAVIALFMVAWAVSVVLYRRMFAADRRHATSKVLECTDATEAA